MSGTHRQILGPQRCVERRGVAFAGTCAADGLSGVLGGAMNSFMDTVISQNVGLIGMTKVVSRYVTAVAGGILIALGLVPKLGEVVAALPGPVVGAAGLVLFATVTMVGINTLRRVDLGDGHNMTIASVSLGVGLLPEVADGIYDGFPSWAQIITGSGITSAAVTAFALNLLFSTTPRSRARPLRRTIESADRTGKTRAVAGKEARKRRVRHDGTPQTAARRTGPDRPAGSRPDSPAGPPPGRVTTR